MMGDRSKLPKWAQQELAQLERQRDDWRRRALEGPSGSDTFAGGIEGDKPLGRATRIRFDLPYDLYNGRRASIEAYIDDGEVVVRATDGTLLVTPSAANSARLVAVRHEVIGQIVGRHS